MTEFEREVIENNMSETRRCIDHLAKITKWLVALGIVGFLSIACVYCATLWYLYQYDFSIETTTRTVTQSTDGGGDANYIGRDGDITNGKADGNYSNDSSKENEKEKIK